MPRDSLFPSDEPVGVQVLHKQGEHYEYVASVESNALGAILMTTHGFMGYARWQDNPRVIATPGDRRSTTIGDVLIGRDGQSLEISADKDLGLYLKPTAAIDRRSFDDKVAPDEHRLEADAQKPPVEIEVGKGGPQQGKDSVIWNDAHLFQYWTATPEPSREDVEDQIQRLKSGSEFTVIVERFAGPPETHFVDIRQDEKLIGHSWDELTEGQKLGQLQVATDVMLLNAQETRELLAREVDITRVTAAEQEAYLGRPFDELGKTAHELKLERFAWGDGPESQDPTAFDRVAANLERQWYDDDMDEVSGMIWAWTRDWDRISYLADFAGAYGVSFERFASAARDVLQLEPGQDFSSDQESLMKQAYDRSSKEYARARGERAGEIAGLESPDREALLRDTYWLNRELGYVGFRHQYFNDPDAVNEWPDPVVPRERELRGFWDNAGEKHFAPYRERHAHETVEVLTAYRDHLQAIMSGDRDGQIAYYDQASAEGRSARLRDAGFGDAKPDGQRPLSPSAIVAQEKQAHTPEHGDGHEHRHGKGHRK